MQQHLLATLAICFVVFWEFVFIVLSAARLRVKAEVRSSDEGGENGDEKF